MVILSLGFLTKEKEFIATASGTHRIDGKDWRTGSSKDRYSGHQGSRSRDASMVSLGHADGRNEDVLFLVFYVLCHF